MIFDAIYRRCDTWFVTPRSFVVTGLLDGWYISVDFVNGLTTEDGTLTIDWESSGLL